MKHIELRQLWLQEQVRSKMLEIEKISTEQNLADVLTKPLSRERLEYVLPPVFGLGRHETVTGREVDRVSAACTLGDQERA